MWWNHFDCISYATLSSYSMALKELYMSLSHAHLHATTIVLLSVT